MNLKKNLGKIILTFLFFAMGVSVMANNDGIGSDAAYPEIEKNLKRLPLKSETMYLCTDRDVESLIKLAAEQPINIFELLDCIYRYVSANNVRLELKGTSFQRLLTDYDFGKERVMGLFPVDRVVKIQVGAVLNEEEHAVDVFLDSAYSKYVEIVTAKYDAHFGFCKVEPNLFSEPFGMKVKKWATTKEIAKIHLYEPGLGAIHVKRFFKPKRWHLYIITKREPVVEDANGTVENSEQAKDKSEGKKKASDKESNKKSDK